MADYIRKTILSQGYAKISEIKLSEEERKAFEITILAYQKPRAERLLCADIQPEVKTKDGSLVVYSTVYGSLSKLVGVTNDLQATLNSLYHSSRMLADACILESLFLSGKSRKNLFRSESRTGVIRVAKDLIDSIEYLIKSIEDKTARTGVKELEKLTKRVAFLDAQLTEPEDKLLIWTDLSVRVRKIPVSPTIFNTVSGSNYKEPWTAKRKDLLKIVSGFLPSEKTSN